MSPCMLYAGTMAASRTAYPYDVTFRTAHTQCKIVCVKVESSVMSIPCRCFTTSFASVEVAMAWLIAAGMSPSRRAMGQWLCVKSEPLRPDLPLVRIDKFSGQTRRQKGHMHQIQSGL